MTVEATVIMYHYVRPIEGSEYEGIKGLELKKFIEEIDYLSKNYKIISSEELIYAVRGETQIPHNSIILSFDDGYKDHYEYVFPELKKRNISGTFFPITKAVTENLILDVNKLHYILASQVDIKELFVDLISIIDEKKKKFDLESSSIYLDKYYKKNRFDTEMVNFIKRLLQFALPLELRTEIVDDLFSCYVTEDRISFSQDLYASKAELKEMLNNGMIIGSHGSSHSWLESLSYKEQEEDIKESILFLNQLGVNTEDLFFCYPYGSYNQDTLSILSSINFKGAFTTSPRKVNLKGDNYLEIPRIDTNDVSSFL